MTRVKRGFSAHRKREKLLRHVKGFKWGRKSKERLAREALLHAWSHAYVGRKQKKRDFRALWQVKISAGARQHGISYNKLVSGLRKNNIRLDRKILAELAEKHPRAFEKIIESAR